VPLIIFVPLVIIGLLILTPEIMPKQDLQFRAPITNSPGSLGFYPDFKRVDHLEELGAFFTNPISLNERQPAGNRQAIPFAGGVLLHNGGYNPGLRKVIRESAVRWADSPLPVIPHLWIENIFQIHEMIERVEGLPGLLAVSLSFPANLSDYDIQAWVEQIVCELPVILQVEPARMAKLAALLTETELSGLSMAPLRGSLPGRNRQEVNGRLYGPAVFPQTLACLQAVKTGRLVILAGGGICTTEQARACLKAGATAVQLDTLLWNDGLSGWDKFTSAQDD
jgi:dihydroorotate dehydrogenase (NAD+) catalytic subunit